MLQGKNNAEKIWNYLKTCGFNDYGVAGLMGNLFAESGLRSNNLQNTYAKKLGFTDETYTASVDSGTYVDFVNDQAGYGLAQWTHWSRKESLLEYAKAENKSIGDLEMQVAFLVSELKRSFPLVVKKLKSATSIKEASDYVLQKYERPADQSDSAKKRRAEYGQKYYDEFSSNSNVLSQPNAKEPILNAPSIPSLGDQTYIVKKGDTLTRIANKYGISCLELARHNGLSNPNLIKVGQVIKIPHRWVPEVGDIVIFNGEAQYYSANSIFGKPCMSGRARIVEIRPHTKHPYHLIYILGGGSNVNKWVDEGTFTKA